MGLPVEHNNRTGFAGQTTNMENYTKVEQFPKKIDM
jgi:hypothetical protein